MPLRHRLHQLRLTAALPSTIVDGMIDPSAFPSPDDPAEALAAVVALRLFADRLERRAVARALEQNWSWSQIAQALGVTKQAAHKRLADVIASERKS
jgi:glycosyltransferase involved in cell wall biosynthesis